MCGPVDHERAGEAVGREHWWRIALADIAVERGQPVVEARLQPIVLDDATARGIGPLPVALPVVRLRIGVPGQNEDRRAIHSVATRYGSKSATAISIDGNARGVATTGGACLVTDR